MKIHRDLQQKSWDWFTARAGKVTGSELGNLITDKGKLRDWKTAMPNSYLNRKVAEKWRGQPLESFQGNRQTEQGNIWEDKARSYFSGLLDRDIATVGGIESDDGRLWCSPDGIIGETVGLEIKCPNADTHVGWLREGVIVPEEHVLQCQFGLYVTGWQEWVFGSFVSDMPHLMITVNADSSLHMIIKDALQEFEMRFVTVWAMLCDRNGGPPAPKPVFTPTPGPVKFSWEMDDSEVIP